MKIKKTTKRIFGWTLALFAITFLFASCQKHFDKPRTEDKSRQSATINNLTENTAGRLGLPYQEGTILLGEQLKNPYTPTLMAQAWDNLQKKGVASLYPVDIRQTHLYVKFKPQNWEEYDDLKEDSLLHLSDIPYDYDIIKNGNYFHDPAVNDTLPTFQYATVPTGFDFNDTIAYEVLSPLYIPERDSKLLGTSSQNEPFLDKLLNEAYTLTGNYEDTIDLSQPSTLNRYTPGGNIQLFDTRLATTYGFEGVKVTARRWFDVYGTYCDFNGNYRMGGSFKRPCNYAIYYENGRFFVKRAGIHWINGPKQKGDWNHTVADGYDRFAGHIFRGAYRYHYKDIAGLQRPFKWLGKKNSYVGKDSEKKWQGKNGIIFTNIKIARLKNKGEEYMSDEIFSTTCHETAHTSHAIRMNTVIQFIQVEAQLRESWAIGIEWVLSNLEYTEKGVADYGRSNYNPPNPPLYPNQFAYQYWKLSVDKDYTSLYINLIDEINDSNLFLDTPNDQVSGYTLQFIETNLLKHIYGLSSLSTYLKNNRPNGVTNAQIDLLLSFY